MSIGGIYITEIDTNEFNLDEYDFIVKIGDIWTFDRKSMDTATSTFIEGVPVPVIYYRNGEMLTTEIVL